MVLTTNDPEIIFNPNILKENKLIDYTLKGNLFDVNQLDYIQFNNIIISNFSYDENNNSKSFSLQLPKGVYKLTIFTKTMQITSLNNTQISVVNSKIISKFCKIIWYRTIQIIIYKFWTFNF